MIDRKVAEAEPSEALRLRRGPSPVSPHERKRQLMQALSAWIDRDRRSSAGHTSWTNAELEKRVETSDQRIRRACSIEQRHIAAEGETTSDLAAAAAEGHGHG